jgi:hypothetical protein
MLIRPAIGDTDPIRYRRPTPDGQFSGNIIDEAMRPRLESNFDPLKRRARVVALAPSELVGVAETARARCRATISGCVKASPCQLREPFLCVCQSDSIGRVELVLGIAGRVHRDLLAHGTLFAPV